MARNATRMLLLIDDEPAQRRLVGAIAGRAGWRVLYASSGDEALDVLQTPDGTLVDAVLMDHWAPDADPAALIAAIRARRPTLPVLMLTASSSVATAVAAMRAGAADYLVKPIAPHRLLGALDHASRDGGAFGELSPLAEKMTVPLGFDEIVGAAPRFRAALAIAAKAARARVCLLIEGESGTGKEVVAQAIHAASTRARNPMVTVNCAAVPDNLIESELFGHEQGAFTGAFDSRPGRFQEADGGTLFLDEVGALSADAQMKLLRALETGEVQPVGGQPRRDLDVRVIAGTNRSLADEVAAGRFREDLYYRLNVVQVTIPPLRDRKGDIAALSRHLMARIARQPGMRELGITDDALALLHAYDWPGNVRQLHNALFRAAVLCVGDALTRDDFPQIARQLAGSEAAAAPALPGAGSGITLFEADGHIRSLDAIEADVIRLAIGHYRGRMTEVARRLGIGRSTLYRKLGELGIGDAAA